MKVFLYLVGIIFGASEAFGSEFTGMITPENESALLVVRYTLNTMLLLFSAALVMWMAAGFCMLEAGLVRSKNTVIICLKNVLLYAAACLAYYIMGYNLMYVDVEKFMGSFQFLISPTAEELQFFSLVGTENGQLLEDLLPKLLESGSFSLAGAFFQMVFVATTASIISGALAERVKLWPFIIFVTILSGLIYPIIGAWTWGNGWLGQMGFKDFAGSTIVHSVGGWAALAGLWLVAPRTGKYNDAGEAQPMPASNVPFATLGVFILWFGWFGFNGGSVLALNGISEAATIGLVFFNTNLAAVAGVAASMIVSIFLLKRIQVLWILNGVIGGLVSITAGPDITSPLFAVLIGFIGGILATLTVPLLDKFKIDDVVGAIPAHLVCGIWGTLAVGIFTEASFLTQLIGVASVGGFVLSLSYLIWFILKKALGLRVSEMSEYFGQDVAELGIEAYPEFLNIENIQKKS